MSVKSSRGAGALTIDSTPISGGTTNGILFKNDSGQVTNSPYFVVDPANGKITVDAGGGTPGYFIKFETDPRVAIWWDNDIGQCTFESAARVAFNSDLFLGDTSLSSDNAQISAVSDTYFITGGSFSYGQLGSSKFNVYQVSGGGNRIADFGDSDQNRILFLNGNFSSGFTAQMGDVDNAAGGPLMTITDATFRVDNIEIHGAGGFKAADGSVGLTGTLTPASFVGKTLTFKNGLITGLA